MKRVPCNELFRIDIMPVGWLKTYSVEGEFYYSTKTDSLYARRSPDAEWSLECDGSCDLDKECPVKNPESFIFYPVKNASRSPLPAGA